MTLDEYKKQIEAKKQGHQLPQFNRRAANEGEDPSKWQNVKHVYRKRNDDEASDEEAVEEQSEGEEGKCCKTNNNLKIKFSL